MGEAEMIGMIVLAIITLGGFIAIIMKFVQPINDLRVVIQKLNDNIDAMKKDSTEQKQQIDKHTNQIDKLDHRVGTLETKMEFYHDS